MSMKNYKRRDVYRIPTEDIIVGENHSRPFGHSAESLTMLAEDILTNGQMQPGSVRRNAEGELELVAGFGRHAATVRANEMRGEGEPEILFQALMVKGNEREAFVHNVRENVKRTDISPIEEAIAINKLVDVHGMTQAQVAEIFGKSTATISLRLQLLNLGDEARKALHVGDITLAQAMKMSGTNEQQQAMALAKASVAREEVSRSGGGAREARQQANQAVDKATGQESKLTLVTLKNEVEEYWRSPGINDGEKAFVDAVLACVEGEGLSALLDWYADNVEEAND